MTELQPELIKKLIDDSAFQIFMAWVQEQIDDLNSIAGLEEKTNKEAGEEVKARAIAMKKLNDILYPFDVFREKQERSVEEVQSAKDRFGL